MTEEEKKAAEQAAAKAATEKEAADAQALKDKEGQQPDPEKEALQKENKSLKFGNELATIATTYPHATEFKDEIQKKVDAGYTVADATIVVLADKKKLVTAEQIKRGEKESSGFGGSMDTIETQEKKDPAPGSAGSAEFYANRFKELEGKREIFIS